jgi:multidrug efflux system membrane fusion protein
MQKSMPRQIRTFGTGEAYATVAVRSMVAGQMLRCHIAPGQSVTKGDILYTLDARMFEATIKQLEAALARNRILAADALRQAEMAKSLQQKGVAAEDETKKAQAVADALQAALLADQANLEKARLDLEYCTIRAPLSGRAGDLLVREGSVIKANDIPMVEIAQTMPLQVVFSVPEVYLPDIRKYMTAGSLQVEVTPREASEPITGGVLAFIDNTVDVETGTIRLKATFPNQDERLWPGQYVNVVVTLALEESGIVVPAQAVQNGQAGTFAFVVRPDQTVEMRPLTVGRTQGDEAVIRAGLEAGETVVTDGHVRLVPGAKVEVTTPDGKPAAPPDPKAARP